MVWMVAPTTYTPEKFPVVRGSCRFALSVIPPSTVVRLAPELTTMFFSAVRLIAPVPLVAKVWSAATLITSAVTDRLSSAAKVTPPFRLTVSVPSPALMVRPWPKPVARLLTSMVSSPASVLTTISPVKSASGTVTVLVPSPVPTLAANKLLGSLMMMLTPSVLIFSVSFVSAPFVSSIFRSLPSLLTVVVVPRMTKALFAPREPAAPGVGSVSVASLPAPSWIAPPLSAKALASR